jgi:hypothetical protein
MRAGNRELAADATNGGISSQAGASSPMHRRLADLALPTPRTTENDLAVTCNKCLPRAADGRGGRGDGPARRQAGGARRRSDYADLAWLVATGYGDTPLRELRFVCSGCGSDDTFAVVCGARHAGY